MLERGMPKSFVSGILAQKTVWYSLLFALAAIVAFSLDNGHPFAIQEVVALSEPVQDSATSGITVQRSFVRGVSESLSVASTFGGPAAPSQSFTRTISDSVGITTGFAPPQSQVARTTADNTPYRSSQNYQSLGQRIEERLNLKNLANAKMGMINGSGNTGGTKYLNLEVEADPSSSLELSGDEVEGSVDTSDPDDNRALCFFDLCIAPVSVSLPSLEDGLLKSYPLVSTEQFLTISSGAIFAAMLIPLASRSGAIEPFAIAAFLGTRTPGRITVKRPIQTILLLVVLFLAVPAQIPLPPSYAAIFYVGAGAAGSATAGSGGNAAIGTNQGLTLPSGLQNDDLMILVHYMTSTTGGSVTTPSGWTMLQSTHQDSGGSITIWYRFYQSGDSEPTITASGLTNTGNNKDAAIAQIAAWRGIDASAPVATIGSVSTNSAAQNIGGISGISLSAGDVVVVFGAKLSDWTSVADLSGDNLSWAEIGEPVRTASQTKNSGLVWDYAINDASNTTVTSKTFTVTGGSSAAGKGVMFSLNASASQNFSRTPADSTSITDSVARQGLYNRSVSDSTTVADSIARTYLASRTITNTITIADTAASALAASRSVSDSTTINDSISYRVILSVSDSVTVTDSPTRTLSASRSVSDATTITDSISMTVSRGITDSVIIIDNMSATSTTSRSISDSATVSDSISTAVSRSVSDSITITDTTAAGKHFDRSTTDSITTTDSISTTVSRSVTDSVTITDNMNSSLDTSRSVANSVTISDTISIIISRSISDTVMITDSVGAGKHFDRSISDFATFADNALMAVTRNIADTLTTSDSATSSLVAIRSTTDSLSIEDVIARGASRSTSDTLSIADDIAAEKAFGKPVSDSISVTDNVTTTLGTSRSISDTVTVSDTITAAYHATRSVADIITIEDEAIAGKHFDRLTSDSTTITDSISMTVSRGITDSVTLGESISPMVHTLHPISDMMTVTDSISTTISRSILDIVVITDSTTVGKHFDRSTTDSVTISDTISIIISRSISDSATVSDSISTAVSRSVSDSITITDTTAAGKHFDRSTTDSITIIDGLSATYVASRTTEEAITVIDSISTRVSRSLSDTVTLAESTAAGKHFDRSVSDTVATTDDLALQVSRNIVDTVTLNDNITLYLTSSRSVSDSLSIADAVVMGVSRSFSDTLSVADDISAEKAFGKPVSDSISVTDNVTTTLAALRTTSDLLTLTDTITTAYHATRSIGDTVVTTDDAIAGKSFAREIDDTIAIEEALPITLTASRTVSEEIALSDGSDRTVALSMSVSDDLTVTTDISAGNAFERVASDSLTLSDAISVLYGPTIPVAENVTITDDIAVGLGPNRSIAEPITITDSIAQSASLSRSISDSLSVTEGVGDIFQVSLLDTFAIHDLIEVEVQGRTVELTDTVNVSIQLDVSVKYKLNFDESLTLGECTPFACNQSLNFYETVALTDEYLPPPKIEDNLTVSDSIVGAKSFGRVIADSLSVQHKVDFIVKFPTPTSTGNEVSSLRVQLTSNKSLVQPMAATSMAGTHTMTSMSDLINQLNLPTATLSTTVTSPDLPKVAVVLPTYHVNMNSTPQLPGQDAMLTVKVAQIPAETPVIVPVNMAMTASMNKTPEVPWMKVDFTPNTESNNFALLVTLLDDPPAGAQQPQANLKPMYVNVEWVGTDSTGNPLNMSDPNYYKADGKPTFTFAVTDDWANSNNSERDSNGVPLISLNLLDDTTGEWIVINTLDRPTSADENGQYVFVAHLEHFSTYVITANTASIQTSTGGGKTAPASFAVNLLDSLQLSEQQRVIPIEIIDEFGGRTFSVVIVDRLTVSIRPVAYQTFQVSDGVNVSIAMLGIVQEGILQQTTKAIFSVQVSNTGTSYEAFQLNFWYYDQSGRRAYESSQEIEVDPLQTREYSIDVPFSSAGTFAVVAEARSVPEGNLLNTTQFTVNIPWLSIHLYSLLSVAAAIIGASAASMAILLIRKNVSTPSILVIPMKRLAGAAASLSLIKRGRDIGAAFTKVHSAKRLRKQGAPSSPASDTGTGNLSLSMNWANAMHGRLLTGEQTAVIDFDAANTSSNQVFLMRYWAVDKAGEVVYSYSETAVIDQERPKLWRLNVDLPVSGDYVFHMECKSARDGKIVGSAQLAIKVP
jgi:hypothetical protein